MPIYLLVTAPAFLPPLISMVIVLLMKKDRNNSRLSKNVLMFTKLILHQSGRAMEENEFSIVKTDNGIRISNYFGNWWNTGVSSRKNCLAKRKFGSLELYNELADFFGMLGVAAWNGFDEKNIDTICNGAFSLEIELENGERVHASGINSYPPNYSEFIAKLESLFVNSV